MILTFEHISPYLRHIRVNRGTTVASSYIDPEYVFTYIKAGRGIYVVEGVEYAVQTGDMVLMAPYMLHITKSEPGELLQECVMHFDLFFSESRKGMLFCESGMDYKKFSSNTENPETLLVSAPIIRTSPPDAVQSKVYRIFESTRKSREGEFSSFSILSERAALLEMLSIYLSLSSDIGDSASSERAKSWRNIEKALSFIHSNYSRNVSLDEISHEAGISMTYFCRLFKDYTGQTIHRYINDLRLFQARRMIEDSSMSFSEIADATGLGDIHSFSKLFKKHLKTTPSEFRRSLKR